MVQVKRDGSHTVFATHAGERKLICSNYGLFDRRGNYYVTDSGQWMKRNGCLCRFTPDGKGLVTGHDKHTCQVTPIGAAP